MGFWDFLSRGRGPSVGRQVDYSWWSPNVNYLSEQEWSDRVRESWEDIRGMSAAQMWRTQPHLRTVVSFLGRNVAGVGLHVFERMDTDDRRRSRDNPLARALANPGDRMTTYQLLFALTVDKLLYDRAFWLPYVEKDGTERIRRLPPGWVSIKERTAFSPTTYSVSFPGGTLDISADRLIEFGGYSPSSLTGCSPTIEALKETLAEQVEAAKYRNQTWKRGGRASAVLKRPLEAPPWTPEQADRFRDDWHANYTGDGPRAGGTPILEDGMSLERVDFSAADQQFVEGSKLSFATVAASYHVNPTMVGLLDDANYSNVREFRRMLYGDTLGPYFTDFEDVINTFALPLFGMDPAVFFTEFNIQSKLQGSFEEQAAVMSTMVGAPIMTRDEGRARFNLAALGGDAEQLVTPLNVLVGGQASPRDSGTQNVTGSSARRSIRVKARAGENHERKVEQVIGAFFRRQEAAVRSRIGAKAAAPWWDEDRWNKELGDDLYALALLVTKEVAADTLKGIGFTPDAYDEARTYAWLREASDRSAVSLNDATREALEKALAGEDPDSDVDSVFANQQSRATMVGVSTVTMLSGFATVESVKQVAPDQATKTWITGANARQSHQAMNGETVPLSENFSNGAAWPGDSGALPAEEVANCNCDLQINVEAAA